MPLKGNSLCSLQTPRYTSGGPNTPERPWLGSQHSHTDEPLTAEHLLRDMDAVGVTRAILVPPNWDGGRHDLVLAAAKKYPDRFAVMRRVETAQPVKQGQIAQWCSEPGVLGLRCGFNKPASAPALKEGRIDWLWSEAQQAGAPIMVTVTHAVSTPSAAQTRHRSSGADDRTVRCGSVPRSR